MHLTRRHCTYPNTTTLSVLWLIAAQHEYVWLMQIWSSYYVHFCWDLTPSMCVYDKGEGILKWHDGIFVKRVILTGRFLSRNLSGINFVLQFLLWIRYIHKFVVETLRYLVSIYNNICELIGYMLMSWVIGIISGT